MRKLQGKDLFTVSRILKKANIKEELVSMMAGVTNEADAGKVGLKAFLTLIEACGNDGVDAEVFKFLDDVLEVKGTKTMDLFDLIELIKQLAAENDLKRFLSLVGSNL